VANDTGRVKELAMRALKELCEKLLHNFIGAPREIHEKSTGNPAFGKTREDCARLSSVPGKDGLRNLKEN